MEKIKIGFVGGGFIGQLGHIENFSKIDNCEIYAIAERRPELRRLVAKKFEIKKEYSTHIEMLQNNEIDAVVVVSNRSYTAPIVYECLKKGKHVLSEKPMAHTLEQGKLLVKTATENNLIYSIGFMKRHDPGVKFAKKHLDSIVKSNELGELVYARSHCFMGDSYCNCSGDIKTNEVADYSEAEKWELAPKWIPKERINDYAWFLNVYSHNINLLRYFTGEIPSVEYSNLDSQLGQLTALKYDKFPAVLETGQSANQNWDEVLELFFELGSLKIKTPPALLRNVPAKVEIYKKNKDFTTTLSDCNWEWSFENQAKAFVEDIIFNREPLNNGKDALLDMEIIENIWRKYLK